MFAIGQTVQTKRSETLQQTKGHVVFATTDEVHVRTKHDLLICKPTWLTLISEDAQPLEAAPIPRDHQLSQTAAVVMSAKLTADSTTGSRTRLSQAQDIYRTLRATDTFSRKSCIKMFQETLGMTEAGASTYFNMCKRTLTN